MPGKKWRDKPGNRADFTVRDVIAAYELAAPRLVLEYESLTFEQVHHPIFDLVLPVPHKYSLDFKMPLRYGTRHGGSDPGRRSPAG